MRLCRVLPGLLLTLLAGCEDVAVSANHASSPTATVVGASFDPTACGTLHGRVLWAGDTPKAEAVIFALLKPDGTLFRDIKPNPHQPAIDAKTRALANAVVFLRGVPPSAAKPWDLPEASVEMEHHEIDVRQGPGGKHRVGFVRRGAAVTMVSKDSEFQNLRARGAAYFSLPFPLPNEPLARTFDKPGLVHLTSATNFFWASAFLFVDDQPYFTRTDAEGRFTIAGVPEGPVEVIAWHPNHKWIRQERDPESLLIVRQVYAEPFESRAKADVKRGTVATLEMTLSEK